MFNKYIKLVLAALIIAFGIYQFTEGYIGNGIMYILLSTVFIFLYFKNDFPERFMEIAMLTAKVC